MALKLNTSDKEQMKRFAALTGLNPSNNKQFMRGINAIKGQLPENIDKARRAIQNKQPEKARDELAAARAMLEKFREFYDPQDLQQFDQLLSQAQSAGLAQNLTPLVGQSEGEKPTMLTRGLTDEMKTKVEDELIKLEGKSTPAADHRRKSLQQLLSGQRLPTELDMRRLFKDLQIPPGFKVQGDQRVDTLLGADQGTPSSVADSLIAGGFKSTGDPFVDAMLEMFLPLIQEKYGVEQPPTELTDQQLAEIAAEAEDRFGPYYQRLEKEALQDFEFQKQGLETTTSREKEDLVRSLKVGQVGLQEQLDTLKTSEKRVGEEKEIRLQRQARNFQQATQDTQDYLANVGLSRGGTRKRAETSLSEQDVRARGDIERGTTQSLEDIERQRRQSLLGFQEQFGLQNLPGGILGASGLEGVQGSVPLSSQRRLEDLLRTGGALQTVYSRDILDRQRQREFDIESRQEEERARRLALLSSQAV